MHIGAIILAAGSSIRMGAFKPLLTIGPKTLLGHAISLFQNNTIDDIVVVTGHHSGDLQQELDRYPCRPVRNGSFTDGMFSSIKIGVENLDSALEAFFLLPVDIPLVRQDTLDKLIETMIQHPDALIIYPEYRTRRGHPPLIRRDLATAILNHDGQGGLRGLLRNYRQQSRNVSVDDPYILLDVDTPNDLVILKEQYLKSSL